MSRLSLGPSGAAIGAALLLVIATLAAAVAGASAVSVRQTPTFLFSDPRTDGKTIVWSESRGTGDLNNDVFGYDIQEGREFAIAAGPASESFSDISDGVVVWLQERPPCPDCVNYWDLYGKDLKTGREFAIDTADVTKSAPAIAGDWVAWVAGTDLLARDVATGAEPVLIARPSPGWGFNVVAPAIDGERVVWSEYRREIVHGISTPIEWRLWTARIGGDPQSLAEGTMTPDEALTYAVSGDLVVYAVSGRVTAVSVDTGQQEVLSEVSTMDVFGPVRAPATDGRYVFWTLVHADRTSTLLGYDRATGSEFAVPGTADYPVRADLGGGWLVWGVSPAPEFYTIGFAWARLAGVLPSGLRPDPGTTSPDWTYYPETSHYLGYGFRDFWSRNGGLPVFGYPLTEEFHERGHAVQYVERQRFEWHPELRGTPYEVLLGRLGSEDAAARALPATAPFQPLPDTTASDAHCIFIRETGHRLCFGFRAYWQSHGLDLGDPGVSFRESLALFGYPISEEFVDPVTGLTVQYFERARFEYHPDNPEPYRVLLGRLGASALSQRGW